MLNLVLFLSILSIFSILHLSSSLPFTNTCQRSIPKICPACCALLYDNDECDPNGGVRGVFRVKFDADGFLGATWESQTRVAEVFPGCLLTLWEERNQTGTNRALGLDGIEVHHLDRYGFDRRASSLICKCGRYVTPPPPKEDKSTVISEGDRSSSEETDSGYQSTGSESEISEILPLDTIPEIPPPVETSDAVPDTTVPAPTEITDVEAEEPTPSEFIITAPDPSLQVVSLTESPQMEQLPVPTVSRTPPVKKAPVPQTVGADNQATF